MDRWAGGRATGFDAVSPIQDILCINCQEMVNLKQIAVHSFACTQVSSEVRTIELQENTLEGVKFRIKKLSGFLKSQKNAFSKSPAERHILSVLFKLSEQLLAEEALKVVVDSLESMTNTCRSALSVLISVERLKGLAVEMRDEMLNKEKNREIWALKAALQQVVETREGKTKEISEIDSKPESVHSGTTSREESVPLEELADCLSPPIADISSPEAARKAFYSLCLATKFSLHPHSKGLQVPLSFLYDKARKRRIPRERWAAFIEESLTNPGKALMQSLGKHHKFEVAERDTRFSYFSVAAITEAEAGTEQ